MNLENKDILGSRPSSFITAPCSGGVDVKLTSLGFQVQNMYSWNKAGSPDRPWHIGPHRASLPKPENIICRKYFHSFSAPFLTHLHTNSNLNHIVLRGLALPEN